MRKVLPLPPDVFGDRSPFHSFRHESALAGPFPYAQFASVCPRFSASRCSTLYPVDAFQTYYVCTRLFVMAIPACPRFSDLVYLYSSVCYACTSSTLFRPSIFVLCNGYTWSTLFRRSILICILLFVVTVPRTRSSDLLYYLYFFVCVDCTLSTLFRPTIFVLVCL